MILKYPFLADITDRQEHTPLCVSVVSGSLECLEVLLQSEAGDDYVCNDLKGNMLVAAAENGHDNVVKEILSKKRDPFPNEVICESLEIAIKEGHGSVIETIIESKFWESAMSWQGSTTLLTTLIEKYPWLAKKVLDRCVQYDEKNKKLSIKRKFLDNNAESFHRAQLKSNNNIIGELKSSFTIYETNQKHPIMIMAKGRQENLLKHPVSLLWTREQWSLYGKPSFIFQSFLYIFYLVSVSTYSLVELNVDAFHKSMEENKDYTYEDMFPAHNQYLINSRWSTIISTALCLFVELTELNEMKIKNYFFQKSNIFDMLLYITTIILLFSPQIDLPFKYCHSVYCWKWPTAAFLLTAAWLNFLRYLRFFSSYGIILKMFIKISKEVLKLSLMLMIFILAFSFSFYITLIDQNQFSKFGWAYLKTVMMSIGEFEFDDVFRGDIPIKFHTITIITLVALIIVMTIVLMNMLIGIAVDNVEKVQKEAELERVCEQIELVLRLRGSGIVSRFINRLRKNTNSKDEITISLDQSSHHNKLYKFYRNNIKLKDFMSSENIRKAYKEKQNRKMTEGESLQREIAFLRKELRMKKSQISQ